MKTIIRVTAKVALPLLMLFAAAVCTQAQQLNVGDVVVATQGGYQVWNPGGSTSLAKATMNPVAIAGNDTAGCAFDSTFRMRAGIVPEPDPNEVVKFGIPFPSTITQTLGSGNGISGPPLSIVFDGDNNFFVGIPGTPGKIVEYDASGTFVNTFSVTTDTPNFISLDISKDGKTLYFTSGGSHIGVFNIALSTTTQISVTNLATVTSFSITSNVVTFTAANNFEAGTNVTISNLSNEAGTTLNGQVLTVLSNGLSANSFEANVSNPDVGPTAQTTGTASANYTLYGLRVLSPFDGSGGYVAAIGLDVANISSTGGVNSFYVKGFDGASNNWQALAFAPDGANFWATNLDNGHLIEFKLAGGETTGNVFDTAANNDGGQSGVCVVGGFSAAQPAPIMKTVNLSPVNNSNTFTFTTPSATQVSFGNGVTGTSSSTNELFETMIFNAGQNGPVTVNVWFIEVGALVGVSDNGVPCFVVDTPTPPEAAAVNRCAIVKVESSADGANPAVFTAVNMTLFTSQPGTNGRYYSDMDKDNTTFSLSDTGPGGCRCSTVYSIQQQQTSGALSGNVSCGYQHPVTGSPSDFNAGSTFPAQFSIAATQHDCAIGNILNSPTLMPMIKMVKLDPGILTGTLEPGGKTAGSSTGPYPNYRYDASRKTWILNIKLNSLPTGCYIATTHDNSGQIVDFSYSAVTDPKTVLIAIGPVSSCNGITLP